MKQKKKTGEKNEIHPLPVRQRLGRGSNNTRARLEGLYLYKKGVNIDWMLN